jgi:hypothetical protein
MSASSLNPPPPHGPALSAPQPAGRKLARRLRPDRSQRLRLGVQAAFLLLNVVIGAFLASPYGLIADVKMLDFFRSRHLLLHRDRRQFRHIHPRCPYRERERGVVFCRSRCLSFRRTCNLSLHRNLNPTRP